MNRIQELLLPTPQLKAIHLARRARMQRAYRAPCTQICPSCGDHVNEILQGLELALGIEEKSDGEDT